MTKNFFKQADESGKSIEVTEGSKLWQSLQKQTPQGMFFIKDDRNGVVSYKTDLSNWNWYGYYLLDCCLMHDYCLEVTQGGIDYQQNSVNYTNDMLNKLCDYGYLPAIMLPSQLQPKYESVILSRITELGLPYIQVHSASFFQHTRLSTKDTWIHKLDVAKLLNISKPETIDVTVLFKLLCV